MCLHVPFITYWRTLTGDHTGFSLTSRTTRLSPPHLFLSLHYTEGQAGTDANWLLIFKATSGCHAARKWIWVNAAIIGKPIIEASCFLICAASPALTPEGLVLGGNRGCCFLSPVQGELFLQVDTVSQVKPSLRKEKKSIWLQEPVKPEKLQRLWKTLHNASAAVIANYVKKQEGWRNAIGLNRLGGFGLNTYGNAMLNKFTHTHKQLSGYRYQICCSRLDAQHSRFKNYYYNYKLMSLCLISSLKCLKSGSSK